MPDTIDFLRTRRSVKPREISGPGPSPAEIETILTIGVHPTSTMSIDAACDFRR